MLSSLALALKPYFSTLLLAQAILFFAAVAVGCLIIITRWTKRRRDASQNIEVQGDSVALEINQEIRRLEELRSRLSTGMAKLSTDPNAVSTQSAGTIPQQSASSVDPMAVDTLKAQMEVEFEKRSQEMSGKVASLEYELAKAREQVEAALKASPATSAGVQAGTDQGEDIQKLRLDHDQEKTTLKGEITQLTEKSARMQTIIDEYKIFEEDFALVKKYKLENEMLKKQLSDTHQVTETDIANLFQSFDKVDAPATETAQEAKQEESFFQTEDLSIANNAPAAVEAASAATPAVTAETVSVPTPEPVMPTAAPTPAPTKKEEAPQSLPAAKAAKTDGFEFERINEEPIVNSKKATGAELEELAESAANDDQLLEEFEKILGDKA